MQCGECGTANVSIANAGDVWDFVKDNQCDIGISRLSEMFLVEFERYSLINVVYTFLFCIFVSLYVSALNILNGHSPSEPIHFVWSVHKTPRKPAKTSRGSALASYLLQAVLLRLRKE